MKTIKKLRLDLRAWDQLMVGEENPKEKIRMLLRIEETSLQIKKYEAIEKRAWKEFHAQSRPKNMASLQAGDLVKVCAPNIIECEFLGFTDRSEKYSDKPVFKNIKEVKKHFGVKTLTELDDGNDDPEYGHSVYGVFKDLNEGMVWCVYLFEGRWVYGSGAERVGFAT